MPGNNVGNIYGTFRMRTEALKRDLAKGQKAIRGFTSNSIKGFNRMGKSILSMRSALIGIAVGVTLRKLTSEFVAFEDALLDLQKVLSDTEGSAKQFVGTVDKLSNRFAEAASNVLQGAANFKQAGFTVQESFELQEQALTLVRISELSAVEASELLISSLKGFKAPAKDAARLVNVLNAVSNKYATNLKQLAQGMAIISPIAKLMGFSFEETAGLLTPIIEVFRSGSEAGNALKITLLRLIDDNSQVVAALDSIGVSQKDLNGDLRSGKEILLDVQRAFLTLDDAQKVFVASQLAGARQAARSLEVLNGMAKVAGVAKVALTDLDSANKELAIRLNSTGVRIDQLKIKFNNMARNLGSVVVPALLDIIEFFGRLSRLALAPLRFDLTELSKDVKDFLGIAKAVSAEVLSIRSEQVQQISSSNLKGVSPIKGSVQGFIEANKDVKLSFADLFKAQDDLVKQVDDTIERFNLQAQGIDTSNKKLAEMIILMREINSTTLVPQQRVDTGFLDPERTKELFIENRLIVAAQIFEIEESAKRVTKAYRNMGLKTDSELRAVGKSLIKNFKTIEREGSLSAERLKEVWATVAPQIEPSVLAKETKEEFDKLNIKFVDIKRNFKEMAIESDRSFDRMRNAVQGWASSFSQSLTDVLFGAELTFGKMLESFTKMIVQMAIQTQIIEPLMTTLFSPTNAPLPGMVGPPEQSQTTFFGRLGFAKGGIASRPTFATLAEREPEIVAPLSQLAGMGGGGNVEVNIIGAPEGTRVEESSNANGGRSINVIIDELVSENINRAGSKTSNALKNSKGVNNTLIGR